MKNRKGTRGQGMDGQKQFITSEKLTDTKMNEKFCRPLSKSPEAIYKQKQMNEWKTKNNFPGTK